MVLSLHNQTLTRVLTRLLTRDDSKVLRNMSQMMMSMLVTSLRTDQRGNLLEQILIIDSMIRLTHFLLRHKGQGKLGKDSTKGTILSWSELTVLKGMRHSFL